MEELQTPTTTININNGVETSTPDLQNPINGEHKTTLQQTTFYDEIDSSCSTPYVSAPSSPGRGPPSPPSGFGFFYSAPASPMHFILSSNSSLSSVSQPSVSGSFEFDFSARFDITGSSSAGLMSSADELFLNGKIRPMKLSSHLQRPQILAPLIDVEDESEANFKNANDRGRDLKVRDRSVRRRTRSMSPLRRASFEWYVNNRSNEVDHQIDTSFEDVEIQQNETASNETTPSASASSSRSSSSSSSSSASRSSKKWEFLKDFLYSRSKSEGRNTGHKFWYRKLSTPSLATSSEPIKTSPATMETTKKATKKKVVAGKVMNGVGKRRVPAASAHELHYTANRAQAEEMRKKTFLPYRQGLLGCLGFSSKSYGAMNGFARALNPVSSRKKKGNSLKD